MGSSRHWKEARFFPLTRQSIPRPGTFDCKLQMQISSRKRQRQTHTRPPTSPIIHPDNSIRRRRRQCRPRPGRHGWIDERDVDRIGADGKRPARPLSGGGSQSAAPSFVKIRVDSWSKRILLSASPMAGPARQDDDDGQKLKHKNRAPWDAPRDIHAPVPRRVFDPFDPPRVGPQACRDIACRQRGRHSRGPPCQEATTQRQHKEAAARHARDGRTARRGCRRKPAIVERIGLWHCRAET